MTNDIYQPIPISVWISSDVPNKKGNRINVLYVSLLHHHVVFPTCIIFIKNTSLHCVIYLLPYYICVCVSSVLSVSLRFICLALASVHLIYIMVLCYIEVV